MNRRRVLLTAVPLTVLVFAGTGCATDVREDAQVATEPPAMQSEAQRQVTFENDQVRVVESTYPVGSVVAMHTHRFPHVLYVIEGGTLQTVAPDGSIETREVYPGDTLWRRPQSHGTRNVGSTPVRIVEVEVKGNSEGVTGETGPQQANVAEPEWTPDPLDPERDIALMLGDPAQLGPYTARLRLGGGYAAALHRHPSEDVHMTVLSGVLYWSPGAEGSGAPEYTAPAGTVIFFPADTPHRLWTAEPTIVQVTGTGPRAYVYIEPEK
jgi:quercetin dioxygenase-like cupin family protein